MRQLNTAQHAQVIKCLCEGNSIRSTARITGVAKNTVSRLLCEIGCACADFHHRTVRGLRVHRPQADEIWSFVGEKKKDVTPEQEQFGWGDVWTWTAIDADTKLCVTFHVGDRGKHSAYAFMHDCASRIVGKPTITANAHKPYLKAVEGAFGGDADYAMLHEIYGASGTPETRYGPANSIDCNMNSVSGVPDLAHVSTSFLERQNLPLRMSMRRFTQVTNGFSKKVENHGHAVALYFAYYNFCRVHQALRVTPAMESGLADHVWSIEELCALIPKPQSAVQKRDAAIQRKARGESA